MATHIKGILGPISGKVGDVVGSSWKGKSYLKSVPRNMEKLFIAAGTQSGVPAGFRLDRRSERYRVGALLILLIVILGSVSGCKSKLFLRKDKHSVREVSETVSDIRQNSSEERLSMLVSRSNDSLLSEYKVIIFPRDTFNFSLLEGFSGRADRILISGKVVSSGTRSDSSRHLVEKKQDRRAVTASQSKLEIEDAERVKVKENHGPFWFGRILLLIVLWAGLFVGFRLSRRMTL